MPKQKPSVLNDYQKRKQAFALRLLFWLLPWPLSRHLPRSLQIIYYGPSASPPGFPPTPPMPPYIPPGQPPPLKPPSPPPGWTPPPWYIPYPSPPPYWDPATMLPGPDVPPDGPPSPYPPYPGTTPTPETPPPPPPLVPPVIPVPAFIPNRYDGYPLAILYQAGPLIFFCLPGPGTSQHTRGYSMPFPTKIQSDQFSGTELKPFWTTETTGGDFTVIDDVLHITAGQDNLPDLTWCYQWPITENFDVKALFSQTYEFNNTWLQAGIVIKSDDDNYAALWFIGEGADPAYSRIVIAGTVNNRIQMDAHLPSYIRIRRTDGALQLLWSPDNSDWYDFTPTDGPHYLFGPMKIGLFCNALYLSGRYAIFDWIDNA